MHTFELDGVRVHWTTDGMSLNQEAWRCIAGHGGTVWISAGSSAPRDDTLATPQERIDAMLLVRMVVHVEYIG